MKPPIKLGTMFLDVSRDIRYGDIHSFIHIPKPLGDMKGLMRMMIANPQKKGMRVGMAMGEGAHRIVLITYSLAS